VRRRSDAPVLITGMPGVGKTTIAVRVAGRCADAFPDGQLFVSLDGRDVTDVLGDVLKTLGVTAIPDDLTGRAAVYRGVLAGRRMLLVLDGASDPLQTGVLLPGAAGCGVLITGRTRLSPMATAARLSLDPPADRDATTALDRIIGAGRVAREPAGAARIAVACGNLPLAIRIMGTRLALRPHARLATFADRLESRQLDELSVGDLDLRTTFAPGYRSLSPAARLAFRAFGRLNLPGVQEWALLQLINRVGSQAAITELIEGNLLVASEVDGTGRLRYRMHPLVRAFARERHLAEDKQAVG
jgi:hypothetical protein